MSLRTRDVQKLVRDAGLMLVDHSISGSDHHRVRVTRPDGLTATFILPASPSDHRGLKNSSARLRRFARGDFNPIQERTK